MAVEGVETGRYVVTARQDDTGETGRGQHAFEGLTASLGRGSPGPVDIGDRPVPEPGQVGERLAHAHIIGAGDGGGRSAGRELTDQDDAAPLRVGLPHRGGRPRVDQDQRLAAQAHQG